MKKYFVTYNMIDYSLSEEQKQIQHMRFQDLLREKLLEEVILPKDNSRIWLKFEIENKEELNEVLSTLPYCNSIQPEIKEIVQ